MTKFNGRMDRAAPSGDFSRAKTTQWTTAVRKYRSFADDLPNASYRPVPVRHEETLPDFVHPRGPSNSPRQRLFPANRLPPIP